MIRIMFICHGNICRSPMAEFVFKNMVQQRGLSDQFEITSSGTSSEELGNPIYRRVVDTLHKYSIPFDDHRSNTLKKSDYDRYDYLIAMDKWNISNTLRILGGDPEEKVCRFLDFSDVPRDIADPWYTRQFDVCYEDIVEACEFFIQYLIDSGKISQSEKAEI